MLQQILATIIIIFFLSRLFWQKHKKQIAGNEYRFWLTFWLIAFVLVSSLKQVDRLVAGLGFSGSGIAILADLAIITLFYFIFRLRLRLAKLEKDLTKITEHLSLNK
jgi:hypothetical protein